MHGAHDVNTVVGITGKDDKKRTVKHTASRRMQRHIHGSHLEHLSERGPCLKRDLFC